MLVIKMENKNHYGHKSKCFGGKLNISIQIIIAFSK